MCGFKVGVAFGKNIFLCKTSSCVVSQMHTSCPVIIYFQDKMDGWMCGITRPCISHFETCSTLLLCSHFWYNFHTPIINRVEHPSLLFLARNLFEIWQRLFNLNMKMDGFRYSEHIQRNIFYEIEWSLLFFRNLWKYVQGLLDERRNN